MLLSCSTRLQRVIQPNAAKKQINLTYSFFFFLVYAVSFLFCFCFGVGGGVKGEEIFLRDQSKTNHFTANHYIKMSTKWRPHVMSEGSSWSESPK